VLESIAQIDGSVVLDRDSSCSHSERFSGPPAGGRKRELGEGGRTAAAIGASQFGEVLMVSEGGQLSFYQKVTASGRCEFVMATRQVVRQWCLVNGQAPKQVCSVPALSSNESRIYEEFIDLADWKPRMF